MPPFAIPGVPTTTNGTQGQPKLTEYSVVHYDVITDPQIVNPDGSKRPAPLRVAATYLPKLLRRIAVPASDSVWYCSTSKVNEVRGIMETFKDDLRRWYLIHNTVDEQNGQILAEAIQKAIDEQVRRIPDSLGKSVTTIMNQLDKLEQKHAESKLRITYKRIRRHLEDVVVAAATFGITTSEPDMVNAVVLDLETKFEAAKAQIVVESRKLEKDAKV